MTEVWRNGTGERTDSDKENECPVRAAPGRAKLAIEGPDLQTLVSTAEHREARVRHIRKDATSLRICLMRADCRRGPRPCTTAAVRPLDRGRRLPRHSPGSLLDARRRGLGGGTCGQEVLERSDFEPRLAGVGDKCNLLSGTIDVEPIFDDPVVDVYVELSRASDSRHPRSTAPGIRCLRGAGPRRTPGRRRSVQRPIC